jgi:hypothetical protein
METTDCSVQAPVGGHDPVVPPDAEPPDKPPDQPMGFPSGAVPASTSAPDFPGVRAQCDSGGTAVPSPSLTPFAATATATSLHGTAAHESLRLFPLPEALTSSFWGAPTPVSASPAITGGVPTSIGKAELGHDLGSGTLVSASRSASKLGGDPSPQADRVSTAILTISGKDSVRCTTVHTVCHSFPKAEGRVRKRKVPPSQISRPPDKRRTPWFKQESCWVDFTSPHSLQFDPRTHPVTSSGLFLGMLIALLGLYTASSAQQLRAGDGSDFTRPWSVARTAIGDVIGGRCGSCSPSLSSARTAQ